MSYLVYLNNYDIRQCKAQYLSVMYEILANKLDAHFILNEDYIKKYNKTERWEVKWVENHWGSYEKVYNGLNKDNYTLIEKPEILYNCDKIIPTRLLHQTVHESNPVQIRIIERILKDKEKDIKAGITWVNNKCFKETLERYKKLVFHHELGPFRPNTYIPTVYLDFSGVNGDTEFDKRFKDFLSICGSVPILSKRKLVRILSPNYYRELYKIMDNPHVQYEIGVGLQVEVDTNLLLFNKGLHWVDPILAAEADCNGKILVRRHPASGFSLIPSNSRIVLDDLKLNKPYDFIGKCEKIYCLNSSIGLEAILLNRKACIFGDSPFANVCNMDEEMQLKALNFIVFGYLVHRDLLFDEKYYKFRLQVRGDEKAIYLDNIRRLLRMTKGE